MATRGRKPQSSKQKRAKGETRPSRLAGGEVIEFPMVDKVPEPPDWMNDDGKEIWHELAPMLYSQRVLTKPSIPALETLCQMAGEERDMVKRRVPVPTSMRNSLRLYYAEFGMTPASAARLGRPGGPQENPFAVHKGSPPKPRKKK